MDNTARGGSCHDGRVAPRTPSQDDSPAMTLVGFLWITLVVAVGATVQGAVGFGLGLVAVPLLLFIEPRCVPAPMLLAAICLTVLLTYREWHSILLDDLKWALGGRVAGIVAGVFALTVVPAGRLGVFLAGLVLVAVALSASGLHVVATPKTLLGAGVLSGFMATTAAIGGPPIALLYQREPGPRLRGTLSAFFVVGASLSLVALHVAGRFGWAEVQLALAMVPGVLIGFLASRRLATLLDRGPLQTAVLVISALAALAVIARELL
jgi:uncharacterized membrane protein YfcA